MSEKERGMSDPREALVALLWEKFGAGPNGPLAAWLTEADCARFADAILAEYAVTPRGESGLADLRDRLTAAVAKLTELRDGVSLPHPRASRLGGKIEGVKLALSYIEEADRG